MDILSKNKNLLQNQLNMDSNISKGASAIKTTRRYAE